MLPAYWSPSKVVDRAEDEFLRVQNIIETVSFYVSRRVERLEVSKAKRRDLISKWAVFESKHGKRVNANKALFVIFSTFNLEALIQFEAEFVDTGKFEESEFLQSLLIKFNKKVAAEEHVRAYVKKSVERRRVQLDRDFVTHELIIEGWQNIEMTKSKQMAFQLKRLFYKVDTDALKEYEMLFFLKEPKLYCLDLMYWPGEGRKLPDGTFFKELYTLIEEDYKLPWCTLNVDYLKVDLFIDFDFWIVSEKCSDADVIRSVTMFPPSRDESDPSQSGSISGTESSSRDCSVYPFRRTDSYLTARKVINYYARPELSLFEAAVEGEKRRMSANSNLSKDLFKVWDEKNLTDYSPNVRKEIVGVRLLEYKSITAKFNGFSSSDFINFKQGYEAYKQNWDSKTMRTKDTMEKIKKIMEWSLLLLEEQRLSSVAIVIFNILQKTMTDDESMLFLYIDSIKELPGSANFVIYVLKPSLVML